MNMDHTAHNGSSTPNTAGGKHRPWSAVLLMLGLIVAFFLLHGHGNLVVGSWPHLLLLACPLTHLSHGRGGHGRHTGRAPHPGQE